MIEEKHKHSILSSIAKARGYRCRVINDVTQLELDESIVTDPNQMSKILLGQTASYKDIESVERIVNYIKKLPNYEELIKESRKEGINFPENKQIEVYQPSSVSWMRQIMDICQ